MSHWFLRPGRACGCRVHDKSLDCQGLPWPPVLVASPEKIWEHMGKSSMQFQESWLQGLFAPGLPSTLAAPVTARLLVDFVLLSTVTGHCPPSLPEGVPWGHARCNGLLIQYKHTCEYRATSHGCNSLNNSLRTISYI